MKQDFIGAEYKAEKVFWDKGPDNSKDYLKNKLELGKDWYYFDRKISYRYNSNGFREKEFSTVDWENSIVILGCSNVLGIGLVLEDNLSNVLEKMIGIPVINLGISGSAIDHACWNSLILHENYPTPKAVAQVWSSTKRYTDFLPVGQVRATYEIFGEKMCPSNVQPFKDHYCAKHTWDLRSKFYVEADRALWRNKTAYVEASFFEHSARELDVPFVYEVDKARDFNHPGVETIKKMAEVLAEQLNKQGVK